MTTETGNCKSISNNLPSVGLTSGWLTSPPQSHSSKHSWLCTEMQRQHCNPPLQKSQSKVYSLLKHTRPWLSSQTPTHHDPLNKFRPHHPHNLSMVFLFLSGQHLTQTWKHNPKLVTYHAAITTVHIHLVTKNHKWEILWIRWACLSKKNSQKKHSVTKSP